jgi:predicted dinucleotide-binding enzyme
MQIPTRAQAHRRQWLKIVAASAAAFICASLPQFACAADTSASKPKIGIIGSGRIGGTLGELWVKSGYEVMFSSLDLAHDQQLAASLGPKASAGTPEQAAAFGNVLLVSVPYKALPELGKSLGGSIRGKVVLDTSNPVQARDGDMAVEAKAKGTGVASPELLPGARLVRAFNSVGAGSLKSETARAGARVAIPIAGDDAEALRVAAQLVQDAGFEPVVVGPLSKAKEFDVGTPVFGKAMTAAELRKALGLNPS